MLAIDFYVVSMCFNPCMYPNGHHFVALEGNLAVFDVISSPLCAGTPILTSGSVPHTTSLMDKDELVWKVAKHSHICKQVWLSFDN